MNTPLITFCPRVCCPLLVTRGITCDLQRLIETASWGEDPTAIEQQLLSHQRFHKSIQRSAEVDRAREELVSGGGGRGGRRSLVRVGTAGAHPVGFLLQMKKGDRGNLYALDQELDSLQVNQPAAGPNPNPGPEAAPEAPTSWSL